MRVAELAKNKGLTVNGFINELMKPVLNGVRSTYTLYRVRVKAGNTAKHTIQVHPKTIRR